MLINTYTYTDKDIESSANQIKNFILARLYERHEITKEVYENLTTNYAILCKKPSFFSKVWTKIFGSDNLIYILVKQDSLTQPDQKDEPKLKIVDLPNKDDKEKE